MHHRDSERRSLITGGAGLIGARLARLLLARGESVDVLDDLSTGRLERLGPDQDHPRLSARVGSAADASLVGELLEGCDRVYHLAATLGVQRVITRPVACFENNLRSTSVVLAEAAARRRPVLFASSSEVYGSGQRVPFREDDGFAGGSPTSARWVYAGTKALGEALAFAHRQESGLPVVVARLFNTVGPGQSLQYGAVLPTFVRQAVRGEPITVHGDGQQTRCFSHVADVVEALVRLMEAPAAEGQVVNVGGGTEVTMLELAHRVRAAAGSDSPIVHLRSAEVFPAGDEGPARRAPDLGRLERLTGHRATIPLEAIIAEMIATERA